MPRFETAPEARRPYIHPAKSKRLNTTGGTVEVHIKRPIDSDHGLVRVRKQVLDTVIQRMQNAGTNTQGVDHKFLAFLMPQAALTSNEWDTLLNLPILVSDGVLQSMLNLEASTSSTPPPKQGDHIYYVRSFRMSADQLRELIAQWKEDGLQHPEMGRWEEMLAYCKTGTQSVFIRYVGMSWSVSAYKRFRADLTSKVISGIWRHFIDAANSVDPTIVTNCRCWTFKDAETGAMRSAQNAIFASSKQHTDMRERALIALFDRSSLLNRQEGGKSTSYRPTDEDEVLFSKLRTNAFGRLQTSEGYAEPSEQHKKAAISWIKKVCDFGRAHPKELGTDKLPPTSEMEVAWAKSATPATFYGHVLLMFIGDYCPDENMRNPKTLWESDNTAQAIWYLKDVLARLGAWEDDRDRWDPKDLDKLVDLYVLPWVDYQYTPKRTAFRDESAEYLRQILAEYRPLVVPTFESRTSAVVRGNFMGHWQSPTSLPFMGVPTIRYFTNRGKVETRKKTAQFDVDENDCFVHIPVYHPGTDKYVAQPFNEIRRGIDMALWQIAVLVDIFFVFLEKGFHGTRFEMCQAAITEFEKRWTTSGCDKVFVKAKAAIHAFIKRHSETKGRYAHHKDNRRAWKATFDGEKVVMNMSGMVTMNWLRPLGHGQPNEEVKVVLHLARSIGIPKGAGEKESVRTIHLYVMLRDTFR